MFPKTGVPCLGYEWDAWLARVPACAALQHLGMSLGYAVGLSVLRREVRFQQRERVAERAGQVTHDDGLQGGAGRLMLAPLACFAGPRHSPRPRPHPHARAHRHRHNYYRNHNHHNHHHHRHHNRRLNRPDTPCATIDLPSHTRPALRPCVRHTGGACTDARQRHEPGRKGLRGHVRRRRFLPGQPQHGLPLHRLPQLVRLPVDLPHSTLPSALFLPLACSDF